MNERPVLLFDVMDTLVYNPFNREIPGYFGLTQEALLRHTDADVWVQFEVGEISEAEYLRSCFDGPRTYDHADFQRVVRDAYRFVDGAERLLKQLRDQGCEIHALSNYPVWFRDIESRLKLSRYLEWTFVSCLTGVRKPDPQAYLGAARSLDRRPEDCLFVDDSLVNCQAAEAIQMPAIHFVGSSALWSELVKRRCVS